MLKKLLNFLAEKREGPQAKGRRIAATNLQNLLGRCPICGGSLSRHLYARFAVTIFTEESAGRAHGLRQALREHRWPDAMKFREFDADRDALVAHALRCPGRQIAWLTIREPYEFSAGPSIVDSETLDLKDSLELTPLISADQWFPLTPDG